jgi:hypothetical protein
MARKHRLDAFTANMDESLGVGVPRTDLLTDSIERFRRRRSILKPSPIETAITINRIMIEKGWSLREAASHLNMDHSVIHRSVMLLKLPSSVQEQVEKGLLAETTACEIARLESPADQVEVSREAIEQGMTKQEVMEMVREKRGRGPSRGWNYVSMSGVRTSAPPSMIPSRIVEELRETLAAIEKIGKEYGSEPLSDRATGGAGREV